MIWLPEKSNSNGHVNQLAQLARTSSWCLSGFTKSSRKPPPPAPVELAAERAGALRARSYSVVDLGVRHRRAEAALRLPGFVQQLAELRRCPCPRSRIARPSSTRSFMIRSWRLRSSMLSTNVSATSERGPLDARVEQHQVTR